MSLTDEADNRRHAMAQALLLEAAPPLNGLSPDVQTRMWKLIENIVVPQLTDSLVLAARISRGSGGLIEATELLHVKKWPGGPQDIQTLTTLQFMLNRIVDHHGLRDYFGPAIDCTDQDRLKKLFDDAIKRIDPSYQIIIKPFFYEQGAGGGHVDAELAHVQLSLEPIPDHPNAGPYKWRRR